MAANPFDWISGVLGVARAVLWQKLIQLGAIWLLGWVAGRLLHLVARRIERSVDDGDDTGPFHGTLDFNREMLRCVMSMPSHLRSSF